MVGDVEAARDAVVASGRALGSGLAELVNLLDPSAVIVGGGLRLGTRPVLGRRRGGGSRSHLG